MRSNPGGCERCSLIWRLGKIDARSLWLQFAQSEDGRELAAQLEAAEDDQLKKQADIDSRIQAAMAMLAKRMDNKPLVAEQKCEAETVYRSRYFDDHVEMSIKLPTEMVLELAEMLTHYEDHSCEAAAEGLDALIKTIIVIMMESVPADRVFEEMDEEDEE